MPKVTAYIGLGSNLETPEEHIRRARIEIGKLDGIREKAFSGLYASPPMGPQDQPDYVNAVMVIETGLPPLDLLHALQAIENAHGRVRGRRWGARTLDLDILVYGDVQLSTEVLTLPHPGIAQRAFVLQPLYECNPDLLIPGVGKITGLIEHCPLNGLRKIAQE